MKSFLFFLLIILSTILLSKEKENKILNKTEEKKTEKKQSRKKEKKKKSKNGQKDELNAPPPLPFASEIPDDTYNLPNDNVYLLNDATMDKVLQNGNNYRWLIILFSETCGHCYFARTEIRKILPDYKHISFLRFAELEINTNPMANMRFNIEGVPYIFILQNNTMYLFDHYPNRKNIMKFLETDLSYFLTEEKRPFPPKVDKFSMDSIKNLFQEITNNTNEFLNNYGIKIKFTPLLLIFTIIFLFFAICCLDYICCLKYCPDVDNIEEQKENNDKDGEQNENENTEKQEKENEDKEINEEKKIKREKAKEKLEKEKKEKENKNNKEEEKEINNKKFNKKNKKNKNI